MITQTNLKNFYKAIVIKLVQLLVQMIKDGL